MMIEKRVCWVLMMPTSMSMAAASCNSSAPPAADDILNAAPVAQAPSAPVAASAPANTHNYAEKEGDTYLYVAAVTEEDQKKGRAVGDVVAFKYLGQKAGRHTLLGIGEDGEPLSKADCAVPCRIITRRFAGRASRTPFEPGSVIGAAFEDALAGRLEVARFAATSSKPRDKAAATAAPTRLDAIPAAFVGEWNQKVEECGTGMNDSRLRIEPRKISFYESEAEVVRIDGRDARTVTVEASLAGEGETWTDKFRLVLSRSGEDLTINGVTRQRCP